MQSHLIGELDSIPNLQQGSIIYYHPFPLPQQVTHGDMLRISKMAEAFSEVGYHVFAVTGDGKERERCFRQAQEYVKRGGAFEFVYAESSNHPSWPSKPNLLYPTLNHRFLQWGRKAGLPIGLYYRDVYWRFPHYKQATSLQKKIRVVPSLWLDWLVYSKGIDWLFLPSNELREYLPTYWPAEKTSPLPPGCTITCIKPAQIRRDEALQVLYVGGIIPPLYDVKPLFEAVNQVDYVKLTVCCREAEWIKVVDHYATVLSSKVHIVHESGTGLHALYAAADVLAFFGNMTEYLKLAMPVKVFEAIGHNTPVILNDGTVAADFVRREDIGWVVENIDQLRALLTQLQQQPDLLAAKRVAIRQRQSMHTWKVRAETVAAILHNVDRRYPKQSKSSEK